MAPQDMLIWAGLELIGCPSVSDNVLNGVTYRIVDIDEDEETVKVEMCAEYRLGTPPEKKLKHITKAELEAKCRENEVEIMERFCGKKKAPITKKYLLSLLEKSGFVDDDEVTLDVKAAPEELEFSRLWQHPWPNDQEQAYPPLGHQPQILHPPGSDCRA